MKQNIMLLWLGVAIIPMGCTMTPEYISPAAPIPTKWPDGAAYREIREMTNATSAIELGWREFLTDEKMRLVIGAALTNNLDLRAAALNVEMARAQYGIQRAGLFPTFNATGDGSKQRVPADLSTTGSRQTSTRYDANFGVASWEIDFFGRIRSLKDKALEEYLASEQGHRSAHVALISAVAATYLTFAADRESLRIAETTLKVQQDAYALIKRRYEIGIATELDLYQAQTQVDTARRDVAAFTKQVAQDENALNLLVGSPVPKVLQPELLGDVKPPQDIRAGVHSEVLLRRPDVLQSENTLKAAYANIGAARAAFFPRISLTAALGAASSDLSDLFKGGQGTWSYTPKIVVPVFDARTWSAFKAAKVQREMAVAQYQRAIQSAFREVADALAVHGTVDLQVSAQEALVHAVSETCRLSSSRYEKGIDSYLSVLDAQRVLYGAQQGLVSLRLAKLTNQVQLYTVLGGGWQEEP